MKSSRRGVARRYGRALLDVALTGGDPAALHEELRALTGVLAGSPELAPLLDHEAIPLERKTALATALAEKMGASPLLRRLIALLVEKGRMGDLFAVAEAYATLFNAHRGTVAVEAVSAVALDDAQKGALVKALAARTGRDVEVRTRVDPRLLGGMMVTMEGRTYDGSVRTRLDLLRRRLTLGGAAASS